MKKKNRNRKIKSIETCLIAILAVLLVLMSITPVAMAAVTGQLRLSIDGTPYVDHSDDAWIHESFVTTNTSFDLNITNHNGPDICYLYLLVAVDRDPTGIVTAVTVDGDPVSFDGTITGGKAVVGDTIPAYEYPGHGIYNVENTQFGVVEIDIPGDGRLVTDETISSVPVVIDLVNSELVKVHFDAVGGGCDDDDNVPVAFVPPSEDVTSNIPEFATIAIPVAAILGLLFLFNHRRRKEG